MVGGREREGGKEGRQAREEGKEKREGGSADGNMAIWQGNMVQNNLLSKLIIIHFLTSFRVSE